MSEPQEPAQRKFKSTDPVAKWLTHGLFIVALTGGILKILPAPVFFVLTGIWTAASFAMYFWGKRIHLREMAEQGFDRKGRPILKEGAAGPAS